MQQCLEAQTRGDSESAWALFRMAEQSLAEAFERPGDGLGCPDFD
jgi:hypothetical protein